MQEHTRGGNATGSSTSHFPPPDLSTRSAVAPGAAARDVGVQESASHGDKDEDECKQPTVQDHLQRGNTSQSRTRETVEDKKQRGLTTTALHLNQYVTRDLLHAAALIDQNAKHMDLIRSMRHDIDYASSLLPLRRANPGAVFGYGYVHLPPSQKTSLLYPKDRKRRRIARGVKLSRQDLASQAEQLDDLIPVRLDLDLDKYKIRDTFTWNLNEQHISVLQFAETLVEDFCIPSTQHHITSVSRSIQAQIHDFQPHVLDTASSEDPSMPFTAFKDYDMRIVIRLDITIGPQNLIDNFEWDINNPDNDPEWFARQLCHDLSLSGEFVTAVAHCIREQTQNYTRSLHVAGHAFDGRPVEDDAIRLNIMSTLDFAVRLPRYLDDFTPRLFEMSEEDLERADKDRERETRRKRRQGRAGRRGAVQLPDLHEPLRTFRSNVINTILPGAIPQPPEIQEEVFNEESEDEEREVVLTQVNYPDLHLVPPRRTSLIVQLRIPGLKKFMASHNSYAGRWIVRGLEALAQKYPRDVFGVASRTSLDTTSLKIKCFDCPGKLYNPGPGTTVDNFGEGDLPLALTSRHSFEKPSASC